MSKHTSTHTIYLKPFRVLLDMFHYHQNFSQVMLRSKKNETYICTCVWNLLTN